MKATKRHQRRARARLSVFTQRLEKELQRLSLEEKHSAIVAVSGGADSTALLLGLDELIKHGRIHWAIHVAHLDHRLRKSSKADAEWVARLASDLGYEATIRGANVRKRAKDTADNLEQAARRARYEFLSTLASERDASLVLTAHTLDDQAETILLRLLRGSAAEGLAAIEPVRFLDSKSRVLLVRPMVTWARRRETERFCKSKGIDFRADEMNEDERFSRVKVRKQLLPLMQSFNNKLVEALGRSAALLREDAVALSVSAEQLLENASDGRKETGKTKSVALNVKVLAAAPPAIRRRALRKWLLESLGHVRRLEMVHFLAVEGLLKKTSGTTIELPNGVRVRRQRDWLHLLTKRVEKRGFDV